MNLTTILEIFGGSGVVLLSIGGCIWKFFQKYDFNYNYKKIIRIENI